MVAVVVHRWGDDVAGRLPGELDDPLPEIGLDHVTAGGLSASLSPVSSVAIDFDFTIVPAGGAATVAMYALASAASRAQHTCPPSAATWSANCSSSPASAPAVG